FVGDEAVMDVQTRSPELALGLVIRADDLRSYGSLARSAASRRMKGLHHGEPPGAACQAGGKPTLPRPNRPHHRGQVTRKNVVIGDALVAHSCKMGASNGHFSNRRPGWLSTASRSPHGGSIRRELGSIRATSSDVLRVWMGSLSPLRSTSTGSRIL